MHKKSFGATVQHFRSPLWSLELMYTIIVHPHTNFLKSFLKCYICITKVALKARVQQFFNVSLRNGHFTAQR